MQRNLNLILWSFVCFFTWTPPQFVMSMAWCLLNNVLLRCAITTVYHILWLITICQLRSDVTYLIPSLAYNILSMSWLPHLSVWGHLRTDTPLPHRCWCIKELENPLVPRTSQGKEPSAAAALPLLCFHGPLGRGNRGSGSSQLL